MSLKKKLLSGGIWTFGGRITSIGALFLINVLLARILTPEEVGTYFLIFNIINFAAILGGFGLKQAVVRFVAENSDPSNSWIAKNVAIKSLRITLLGAAAASFIYLIGGRFLATRALESDILANLTVFIAVWIFLFTLQRFLPEVYRGYQDMRLASIFDGALPWFILLTLLFIIWYFSFPVKLWHVILFACITGLISIISASALMCQKFRNVKKNNNLQPISTVKLLDVSSAQWITSITFFIATQADVWIIGTFQSMPDVAIYGAAAKLTNLVALQLVLVNLVVQPMVANMYARGEYKKLEKLLRTTTTFVGIPAFLILIPFLIWPTEVLSFIYGAYYQQGGMILRIIIVGKIIFVWSGSCGILLNMTGFHRQAMIITLLSSVLSVCLAIFMVGPFGKEGVALASSAGIIAVNVLMVIFGYKKIGIRSYMYGPFFWPQIFKEFKESF